ncbi:MAG: hypothetical protein KGQ37_01615 [Hyphomicrobiales bacterium]|nr:hypothetical protein [Hyphomicrobiales bacterium]
MRDRSMRFQSKCGMALAAGLTMALAGCGAMGGPQSSGAPASTSSPLASLLAFHTTSPPPLATAPKKDKDFICPHIEILQGASDVRVGGAGNSTVNYQFSLDNVARQCDLENGQIAIKVGAEGRVLLGPDGKPGTFQVPVRFAIRRESDQKAAATDFVKVAVNIPADHTQGAFTAISQPMLIPDDGDMEDQDFTVLVGFDQGQPAKKVMARHRRPLRRKKH